MMKRINIIWALLCVWLVLASCGAMSEAPTIAPPPADGAAAPADTAMAPLDANEEPAASAPKENEEEVVLPAAPATEIAQAPRKASTKKSPPPPPGKGKSQEENEREEEVVVPATPGADVGKPVTPPKPVVHRRKKPVKDTTKTK